ncbi:MAG TPA: hypothetical protein VNW54_06365 [Granulicella sp.]|jgi:protein CpxP|nr:hypothetical protein [Granulicella sp.]
MNRTSGRMTAIGRVRMRGATLALCVSMLGTISMAAQDQSAPPPPPQGDGAQAGGRPTTDQMVERQIEHLTKAASLTPDQATQVRPILKDEASQLTALREDTTSSQQEKRGKMMQIRSDAQAKIRALLSSDQQTQYDALLAQEQQRMGRRRGGGQVDQAPPPPPSQP